MVQYSNNIRIQQRNTTAADWASTNPVLLSGEIGIEKDTLKFKIGDGTTAWNALPYAGSDSVLEPATADTLGGIKSGGDIGINTDGIVTVLKAAKLATARTITLTGDITGSVSFDGSGNVSIATTRKNSGVTAGTYRSVTVNAKGDVTAGTNPTTLSAYGITDATPSSHIGSGGTSHALVNGTTAGFMSASDKTKLDSIAANANNYVHPNSHPATMITTDADNRFITDAERTAWNAKQNALGYIPLNSNLKGAGNGLAELDSSGKVPASQLPSYVDDVIEAANLSSFPATGESGKIYVAIDTNKTYRWTGSAYVEISASLALGETSSTAYRGDRGKSAYDHSQLTSGTNPHNTTFANIASKPTTLSGYGITDAAPSSHVGATGNAHSDATTSASGFMSATDKTKLNGITAGANKILNHANNGSISVDGTEQVVYIHPTGAGNNHIPTGGTVGQVLKNTASGTAAWQNETTYTHPANHPASIITQDSNNRFVSDTEKTTWTNKASKAIVVDTTITTSWAGTGPYTQTIPIAGVTATNIVEISLKRPITAEQREAFKLLDLEDGGQSSNSITLEAWGRKNTVNIPIKVIIRGDI